MTAHHKVTLMPCRWHYKGQRKVHQFDYYVAVSPEFHADAEAMNAPVADQLAEYNAACASGTAVIVSEPGAK